MASSSITIGELVDVPAPNSPINAQFHQEVANRITHRFANVAQRDTKWSPAAAGDGARCITLDTNTEWISDGAVWRFAVGGVWWAASGAAGSIPANVHATLLYLTIPARPSGTILRIDYGAIFRQSATQGAFDVTATYSGLPDVPHQFPTGATATGSVYNWSRIMDADGSSHTTGIDVFTWGGQPVETHVPQGVSIIAQVIGVGAPTSGGPP